MIRDYFRFPQRQGARPQHEHEQHRQESGRRSPRSMRDNPDWDRWPDAEALRWSPRAAREEAAPTQDNSYFEEGYGYGDAYFGDDQRAPRSRFQEGWEGSYRSAPWTARQRSGCAGHARPVRPFAAI
ncbi:hypothetical protein [Dyella acidiphila]|uniref:Uncharacterized protein n=1 Tax=Dyella acidiphila TaxID=2775866 RepID=A0ABR9GCQ4_9GAMM|nr:hypothetical protein [Dyella acidiphila]MBE1161821.1 hypothetical protein [Dyella acidiphila]